MTVAELYQFAWQGHWNTARYVRSGWAKEVEKLWLKHLAPTFGHVPYDEMAFSRVRTWHRRLESTPYAANRSLEVLSRIFSFCEDDDIIPRGFNPCVGIKGFPEKKRRRYATEAELKRIGEQLVLHAEKFPLQVAFVYLVALTGARPESIFALRFDDIEYRGDVAIIHFHGKGTSDSGSDESLVLGQFLLKLLQSLPRRDDGRLMGEIDYRYFWGKITKAAGCPGLWLRDLRRTFGSTGLSDGVGLNLIGELLNHKSLQTTMNYAKLYDSARVTAAVRISTRIEKMLGVSE